MHQFGEADAPVAHNEGSGDPNIGSDSMYEAFDSMDDFDVDVDPSDFGSAEETSPADNYQSEGEGELEKPFCEA